MRAITNPDPEEIGQLLKPIELTPLPENPLVSVLTANYNYACYLSEAIESVLAQTYANFEMIVCDDGSTDQSCEVAERYAQRDPRIKLLRKENGGQASAWNAAYRESKGEIVCILDADDRYLPEKLETVARAFRSRPDSGFLGHRMFRIDADGRRCGVTSMLADHPSGWYGPFIVRYGDVPPGLAISSGLCLRREISNLIFPLPDRFRTYADGVIMVLAPLMTPIIGTSVPLGEYRYHGENFANGHATPESLDRELHVDRMLWEVRREYLGMVHPRLAEVFPDLDHRWGPLVGTYILSRLQTGGKALRAYRNLVRAEMFFRLHFAARWFWRFSILLPQPLFRYVLDGIWGPGRLKELVWRAMEHAPGGRHLDSLRITQGSRSPSGNLFDCRVPGTSPPRPCDR